MGRETYSIWFLIKCFYIPLVCSCSSLDSRQDIHTAITEFAIEEERLQMFSFSIITYNWKNLVMCPGPDVVIRLLEN